MLAKSFTWVSTFGIPYYKFLIGELFDPELKAKNHNEMKCMCSLFFIIITPFLNDRVSEKLTRP